MKWISTREKGGRIMKNKKLFTIILMVGFVLGMNHWAFGAEGLFRDYNVCVVQELEVPKGSPAPESSGLQMAEKAVYQIQRYSQKYGLFEAIAKEGGKASQEIPSGKKILIIKGEVKEYVVPTVGRQIGRSFIPGVGGHVGSATFAAHYTFIDKETGKVIYETDLRTTSTGSNDTVEYAMDRNGEALAKLITKYKGR
jgi:hypothetical protein